MKQIEQPSGAGHGTHIIESASISVVLWDYKKHSNPVVEIRSTDSGDALVYCELEDGDVAPDTEGKALRVLLGMREDAIEELLKSRFNAGFRLGREDKLAEIREILGIERC